MIHVWSHTYNDTCMISHFMWSQFVLCICTTPLATSSQDISFNVKFNPSWCPFPVACSPGYWVRQCADTSPLSGKEMVTGDFYNCLWFLRACNGMSTENCHWHCQRDLPWAVTNPIIADRKSYYTMWLLLYIYIETYLNNFFEKWNRLLFLSFVFQHYSQSWFELHVCSLHLVFTTLTESTSTFIRLFHISKDLEHAGLNIRKTTCR